MNNSDRKLTFLLIGLPVIIFTFFIGFSFGQGGGDGKPQPNSSFNDESILSNAQFAPFWKAWKILDEKSVKAASTTAQDKVWGAIEGLASSYKDPYTVFMPPEDAKMFKDDIAGNFEGVGMEIGIKDNQLTVLAPIKGSPADRAGVRAGDKIISIDGQSAVDMSVEKAVKIIRGEKGTTVKLTFLSSDSAKPVEKSIVRDVINIPTLDTSIKGDVFVIRLNSFTAQSPELFRQALREFVLAKKHKLVLDLRSNPGGYLEAAVDMASWFLPAGTVIVTEDFGKNRDPLHYRSKGYDVFNENLRMIILVDAGSASASEILAGALKERGIAKLVGTKTFGKGSVQELVSLTPDTSLKITIARWMTPNGHNLSENGLVPDHEVKVTEKDIADKKDPQMDKALELLSK